MERFCGEVSENKDDTDIQISGFFKNEKEEKSRRVLLLTLIDESCAHHQEIQKLYIQKDRAKLCGDPYGFIEILDEDIPVHEDNLKQLKEVFS